MKKTLIASVLAATLACPLVAGAQEGEVGPWLLRGRVVNIDPNSSSTAGGAAGLPADAISVQNRWAPEVDVSYFFTKNIALELIATYPQSQPVSLNVPGLTGGRNGIGCQPEPASPDPALLPLARGQPHVAWRATLVPVCRSGQPRLSASSTSWAHRGISLKVDRELVPEGDRAIGSIQVMSNNPGPKLVNSKLTIDPYLRRVNSIASIPLCWDEKRGGEIEAKWRAATAPFWSPRRFEGRVAARL
jgi:hypothetical protein